MDFDQFRQKFERRFVAFITQTYGEDEPLAQGCHYALQGQGKRVRPLLTLLACEALGKASEYALSAAIAVELIHTYSLIHDDLPCMDNDDFRRGRATLHRKFDEATALLTGDALLSDAWAILSGSLAVPGALPLTPATSLAMVAELAQAVGSRGMVQGQMMDLYWTSRPGYKLTDLLYIHKRKTALLISSACVLGGLAADANHDEIRQLRSFGENLGLAFQVIDDLLDDHQGLGKTMGKDRDQGKVTFLAAMPRTQAVQLAQEYTQKAKASLLALPQTNVQALLEMAEALLGRQI